MKQSVRRFALLLFACNCLAAPLGVAQESTPGIQFFTGNWKDAAQKAKAEHKCIFLDAYASWGGPCKTMDREVFVNREVADYFNAEFIAIRIDMEKGEGPELAKKMHSINGYSSLGLSSSDFL